jgi:hypothetical protein
MCLRSVNTTFERLEESAVRWLSWQLCCVESAPKVDEYVRVVIEVDR